MKRIALRPALSVALFASALTSAFAAGSPAWTTRLPDPVKWQQTTSVGTLLVGTGGSIYSLDIEEGITNLQLVEGQNTVMVADARRLIGLDLDG